MARGINKVILVGNLGGDPELRVTQTGTQMTTLSIATSESWRDKQTGQQQERTEWHRVVFFNRLAEIASQYLRKGSKVYIEGSLRTRKWQDQQGMERYTTEIIASDMQMLDSRGDNMGGGAPSGGGYSQAPQAPAGGMQQAAPEYQQQAPQQQYQQAPQQAPAPQQSAAPAPGFDDFDDDIPF